MASERQRESPSQASGPAPQPAPNASEGEGEFVELSCLVTLDGRPQAGGVLRCDLGSTQVEATSDARGRARLRLPLGRYARLSARLPRAGLDRFQAELREPGDEARGIESLALDYLLVLGDPAPGAPRPASRAPRPQPGSLTFEDEVEVSASPGDGFLELAFSTGALLRGRVLDPAGRPAPGARVYAEPRELEAGARLASAETDEEGRFELRLSAHEALDLAALQAETPGGAGSERAVASQERLGFEPFTIRLRAGEPLRGWVRDAAGRALPARVLASVDSLSGGSTWATTCDAEGAFWFGGLAPPGDWLEFDLRIGCPGYAPRTVLISRAAGGPPLELVLEQERRCRGRVVSASGAPVEGAELLAIFDPAELPRLYGPARSGFERSARAREAPRSDAQGRFEFQTRAGPRLLVVSAPGHGERVLLTSLMEDELLVQLQPGGAIAGSIQAPEGETLEERLLTLVPRGSQPGGSGGLALAPGPTRALESSELPTSGVSTRVREGRFRFQDVPPGRYDLYARILVAGEFVPLLVARNVAAGQEDVSATFAPPPRAELEVQLRVGGLAQAPNDYELRVWSLAGRLLTTGRADPTGKVSLSLRTLGEVLVEGQGYGLSSVRRRVELEAGQRRTMAPFVLEEVEGRVVVEVLGSERFRFHRVQGKDPLLGRWVDASYSMGGEARLLTFPPGTAEVRVQAFGEGETLLREVVRRVEVGAGAGAELSVDLASGR